MCNTNASTSIILQYTHSPKKESSTDGSPSILNAIPETALGIDTSSSSTERMPPAKTDGWSLEVRTGEHKPENSNP